MYNFKLLISFLLLTLLGTNTLGGEPKDHFLMANTGLNENETDVVIKNNENHHRIVVIIGASYAANLKKESILNYDFINKGVGGEQSFDMLARFNRDVVELKPKMVIIWGFINDIFRSPRADISKTVDRIQKNFQEMVEIAQKNGIIPVVATEITMSMRYGVKEKVMGWIATLMGKTSYQDYVNHYVMKVNAWLREYTSNEGVKIIDLQALLAEGEIMRKKKYSQADGSHISEEGYRVIRKYIDNNVTCLISNQIPLSE